MQYWLFWFYYCITFYNSLVNILTASIRCGEISTRWGWNSTMMNMHSKSPEDKYSYKDKFDLQNNLHPVWKAKVSVKGGGRERWAHTWEQTWCFQFFQHQIHQKLWLIGSSLEPSCPCRLCRLKQKRKISITITDQCDSHCAKSLCNTQNNKVVSFLNLSFSRWELSPIA